MRKAVHLYHTSVGKKVLMAATGVVLFLFVLVHMLGNLKIYQGPEKFDAYARFLREVGAPAFGHGELLWLLRLVLLACVAVHIVAAWQLYLQSRRARRIGYAQFEDLSFSYASRTMRWGGVIILLFVVYHVLDLTLGTVHPGFEEGAVYHNVVSGFRVWYISLAYIVAMIPLGLHIYHGLWSGTQTLALQRPGVKRWRRPVAAAVAGAIVLGNVSVPLAVLAGLVH